MEAILIWSQLSTLEEVSTLPSMEAILIWSQLSSKSVHLSEYGGHLNLESALQKKCPPLGEWRPS